MAHSQIVHLNIVFALGGLGTIPLPYKWNQGGWMPIPPKKKNIICGVRYDTTCSTLASVPDSMLITYLERWSDDKQHELFIDRDGQYFGYILNYLRDRDTANMILPKDLEMLQKLEKEADFYLLPELKKVVTRKRHITKLAQLKNKMEQDGIFYNNSDSFHAGDTVRHIHGGYCTQRENEKCCCESNYKVPNYDLFNKVVNCVNIGKRDRYDYYDERLCEARFEIMEEYEKCVDVCLVNEVTGWYNNENVHVIPGENVIFHVPKRRFHFKSTGPNSIVT